MEDHKKKKTDDDISISQQKCWVDKTWICLWVLWCFLAEIYFCRCSDVSRRSMFGCKMDVSWKDVHESSNRGQIIKIEQKNRKWNKVLIKNNEIINLIIEKKNFELNKIFHFLDDKKDFGTTWVIYQNTHISFHFHTHISLICYHCFHLLFLYDMYFPNLEMKRTPFDTWKKEVKIRATHSLFKI